MASPALAEKIGSRFPANLHGAPMLLPGKDSALHLALPRWLERMNVRPRIVGEFSDSALMKAFGEAGAGIFPTPALSVAAVCEHYKVDMVGETNDIKERFFLISAERKLAHPLHALSVSMQKNDVLTRKICHGSEGRSLSRCR